MTFYTVSAACERYLETLLKSTSSDDLAQFYTLAILMGLKFMLLYDALQREWSEIDVTLSTYIGQCLKIEIVD